ncbi:MAG: head-tail connector protein [Peptostreptococcaceae bacterium]|nr:head-tail connector protein [Peptostreptococcaceae bacterium]
MLNKAKLLLGIKDNDSDELLSLYLEMAKQKAMNYCNRDDIPPEMELVIVEMVATKYKESQSAGGGGGAIESIKRGDTEIKYASGAKTNAGADIFDSFTAQLARFAKMRTI